jgi:hypothetical protein
MSTRINNIYQKYIINKSSPQGTQRTQDVCTIFFLLRTTILGVFQQQLNIVQIYKSTSSIMQDSSYTLLAGEIDRSSTGGVNPV